VVGVLLHRQALAERGEVFLDGGLFLLAPGPVFLEQGVAAEVGSREHEGGARTRALDIGREATISEGRQASVWRTILPSIM